MEKTPLLSSPTSKSTPTSPVTCKLYKRRWIMLLLASLVSVNQCNVWITYGTLSETTKDYYKVGTSMVNLLAAYGPIAFIPFSIHSSWAIAALGLRKTVFLASLISAAGACLRCLATTPDTFWLIMVAQILNAIAGPVVMTFPPTLSALWFGPHERTFSTSIAATANSFGGPVAYFLGLLVTSYTSYFYLLYAEALFGIVTTLFVFILFRDRPPSPPSLSSQSKPVSREADGADPPHAAENTEETLSMSAYLRESWKFFHDIDCMNIVLTLGTTVGVSSAWSAMLVNIIVSLNYSQTQAQWIGLIFGFVGMIGGLSIGKLHDMYRHFKTIMLVLLAVLAIFLAYFTLATASWFDRYFEVPYWSILGAVTVAGFAVGAVGPLGYESLAELSYPMSETVGAIMLNNLNNLLCLVFLMTGNLFSGAVDNWLFTGAAAVSVISFLFLKENYYRSRLDFAPSVSINK